MDDVNYDNIICNFLLKDSDNIKYERGNGMIYTLWSIINYVDVQCPKVYTYRIDSIYYLEVTYVEGHPQRGYPRIIFEASLK
jgi:hypothetical protein